MFGSSTVKFRNSTFSADDVISTYVDYGSNSFSTMMTVVLTNGHSISYHAGEKITNELKNDPSQAHVLLSIEQNIANSYNQLNAIIEAVRTKK